MIFDICKTCPHLIKAEGSGVKFTICLETGRVLKVEFEENGGCRISEKEALRPPCMVAQNKE